MAPIIKIFLYHIINTMYFHFPDQVIVYQEIDKKAYGF
jgi:hypothetical protein